MRSMVAGFLRDQSGDCSSLPHDDRKCYSISGKMDACTSFIRSPISGRHRPMVAAQMKEVYEWVLGGGAKPRTVVL